MEVRLASGFLPLLLLAWLPAAGLSHQISATIDVSVGLDLILQCLLQAGSNSTARGVKWFNTTQNNGEKQNEDGVEMKNASAQLVFPSVNKAHSGMYTCRMENMRNMSRNKDSKLNPHGTVSQPRESVIATECRFKIWSENLTVHVKWYRPSGLQVGNQTDTIVLGENCANLTSPGMHAANTGICGCKVFITRINLTDTGNGTQGTVPSCSSGASQAKGTWIETWAGLNFPLCIVFSLAAGTLLYMPIIGLLLWQCRRNRKGKITSRQVVEGDQLSMASPVTGTDDLTYANLMFEKKGAKPTSSDVVYTEIKPSQQQQSGRDAGAANTAVDVSPKGEDK